MKFYVAENGTHVGPFDIDELQSRGITSETLVWAEGFPTWQQAGNVPELASIIIPTQIPPVQQVQQYQQPYQQAQNQYQQPYQQRNTPIPYSSTALIFGILECLFCCLITGIIGIVYWSKANTAAQMGDKETFERSSRTANTWLWVGFGLGLISIIGYIILVMVLGGAIGSVAYLN